ERDDHAATGMECRKTAPESNCHRQSVNSGLVDQHAKRTDPKQSEKESEYHCTAPLDKNITGTYSRRGVQTYSWRACSPSCGRFQTRLASPCFGLSNNATLSGATMKGSSSMTLRYSRAASPWLARRHATPSSH